MRTGAISEQVLLSSHFPDLIEFKIGYVLLWRWRDYSLFLTGATLQSRPYPIVISMADEIMSTSSGVYRTTLQPFARRIFSSDSFSQRNDLWCNTFPREYSSEPYNRFKSRVNRYRLAIFSQSSLYTLTFISRISFNNPLH